MAKMHCAWYVYELIDPRCGTVFYVGKGSGNRIEAHEREAAKKVCSRKTKKIKEIWDSGLTVIRQKVAMFWDEQAAYDHETDRIEEYGLKNLTNVLPGGQKAWERRVIERQSRKPSKPLHQCIEDIKSESLFRQFADWFRIGGHTGTKVIREYFKTEGVNEFHIRISLATYNKLAPYFWDLISADEKCRNAFSNRMRKYNVEFV